MSTIIALFLLVLGYLPTELGVANVRANDMLNLREETIDESPIVPGSDGRFAQRPQQIDVDIKLAFEQCRGSKDLNTKMSSCSFVIQRSKNKSQVERAYNSRGLANMALKNFSNAVQDFSRAMELDKQNAGYVDNRQGAFFALGQLDHALEDANRAVRLAPNKAFAYRSRGLIFGEMKSYDKAIKDMTTAISLDHTWIDLFVERGKLFAKAGRSYAAISDFDRALELDPNLTWANRERGLTYKLIGDRERAQSDLLIALRAQPDDIEVVNALRELQVAATTAPPSKDASRQQRSPVPTVVSSGSGFFVSTEGHIVTNAHVVEGCTYVRSSRGGEIRRVAIDEASDLALYLASERSPVAALIRGGKGPRAGEAVVAIGFPFKGLLSSDPIVTTGTISALAGIGNDRRTIQITAPVQPGNSGGPLLGENGSVVGVVVGKLDALKMVEVTGDIPQNVNFAVSLGTLQSFLNAQGVPYVLDDTARTKTPADIAADASRHTVLLECLK